MNHLHPAMFAILCLRTFWAVLRVSCLQHRNLQFWNAETIVHTFFAMEHVHHKLLQVIGMIPQQFSSNENKKLITVRECSLFGTNFVILNTATLFAILCKHFSIKSLCAFDICWWYNKMAYNAYNPCIILHTVLVRHLFLKSSFHTCTPGMIRDTTKKNKRDCYLSKTEYDGVSRYKMNGWVNGWEIKKI